MCDCYTGGCKQCGRGIETHIGDFSTSRNNVKIFCGKQECVAAAMKYLCDDDAIDAYTPRLVFTDRRDNGEIILFIAGLGEEHDGSRNVRKIQGPGPYGIHLNE